MHHIGEVTLELNAPKFSGAHAWGSPAETWGDMTCMPVIRAEVLGDVLTMAQDLLRWYVAPLLGLTVLADGMGRNQTAL